MVKYEEEPCACGNHYIQNRTKWLCSDCVYKRNHGGKARREVALEKEKEKQINFKNKKRKKNKKKSSKKKKEPTGEYDLFLVIWGEREHICHNCKMNLDRFVDTETGNPSAMLFMHMVSKGANGRLRLKKKNIKLGCPECHYAHDHQGKKAFKKRKNLYKNEQIF